VVAMVGAEIEYSDVEEYCAELCYHEFLCDNEHDCIDYDCYYDCILLNELDTEGEFE